MGRKKKAVLKDHLFGLIIMCGVCGSALAFAAGFGVDNFSQLAVGAAADAMCMGGPDAKCPCGKGLKDGKCDPNKKGGGKIGCPCSDVTSGDVAASGKCGAVGKCKADKADGMMPMLPMIPMMMPMPKMDMPKPCQPKTATTTPAAATSTATTTDKRVTPDAASSGSYDPNCPENFSGGGGFGAQGGGNFWGSVWDNVNPFASPDDTKAGETTDEETPTSNGASASVWGNLMKSLGISNEADPEETEGGTGTGAPPGATGTTTGGVAPKGGAVGTGTTSPGATNDFVKAGTTFTYEADAEGFEDEAASVLDEIKKTLEKLLEIVRNWF